MNEIVKKNGLNFGLILGFLIILPTLLGYVINISLLVSYWTIAFIFVTVIVVGIVAIGYTKRGLGGYINFKNAFSTYFVMIVVGVLISTAMNILLFKVVDSKFADVVKEKQIEKVEEQREWVMNKMPNAPDEQFEEMNDKFDEAIEKVKADDPYSLVSQVKGIAIFLSIFSVFGLLLALMLKKKDPALE